MKGDFSRLTFAERKHYRRVLMQQGRVQVDADGNEQIAIDAHLAATTTYDVIGQSGYPLALLADGTPAGGFAIALAANGADLSISKGRFYVDGLLVENERADATLLKQPDSPYPANAALAALNLVPNGVYVVYLDAWERLITALDDPAIRESALGGPDTSVRTKLVWQVKLALAEPRGNDLPTCASVGDGWRPANPNPGRLAARTGAPKPDELPCILPPQSGYRRLENQLYRVEIHTAGGFGTATYKWSRENGSVVVSVVAPGGANPPPTVSGPAFTVASLGLDASLGFKAGDWVELTDDATELAGQAGQLLRIGTAPANGTITTSAAAANPVDLARHPKLRRWDQTGAGLEHGVQIVDGGWVELEDGVEVQFSDGHYEVGDYWLIPARTKTSVQSGNVEWPLDEVTATPSLLPPRGIAHHYAQLALVAFSNGAFAPIGGTVPDCRHPFPPLTASKPEPRSPCTLVVVPGPDWEQPIRELFKDPNAAVDAEICFPVGTFAHAGPKPLVIETAGGNVKVSGAGWGTKLVGTGFESVLSFARCASVQVRDLSATTTAVDPPGDAGGRNINGTLQFSDCGDVLVEDVRLACGGSDSVRGASCITVRNAITDATAATGVGSVRIRSSRMEIGALQYGILVVHAQRTTIEDNQIVADPTPSRKPVAALLEEPRFLAAARSVLFAGAPAAALRMPPAAGDVAAAKSLAVQPVRTESEALLTVLVGNQEVTFKTHPQLRQAWTTLLNQRAAKKTFATERDALMFVKGTANAILTEPMVRSGFTAFSGVVRTIQRAPRGVAARGIVIGGRGAADVRIRNNTIDGALQAITAGVSHTARASDPPDRITTITISGNTIGSYLSVLGRKMARHGISVGNADSVLIENNRAGLTRDPHTTDVLADGIHVYGYLGKRMIVRHNHVADYDTGIRVVALKGPGSVAGPSRKGILYQTPTRDGNLWLVADNAVTARTGPPIDAAACLLVDNAT
jgi:Family of unknown function (DUF6519)